MLKSERTAESHIHYVMCFTGGYLGMYSILNRSNILATAQTANMIHFVADLLGRDWNGVLLRIGAILIYMAAIVSAAIMPKMIKIDMRFISIVLDIMIVAAIGFFPENMNHLLALYPVFFIMAFQWCVFSNSCGYVSSTIFSTNNLRQFTSALCEYVFSRDIKQRKKAAFYGYTLLFYHIGAVASLILSGVWGLKSVWACVFPLIFALVLAVSAGVSTGIKSWAGESGCIIHAK